MNPSICELIRGKALIAGKTSDRIRTGIDLMGGKFKRIRPVIYNNKRLSLEVIGQMDTEKDDARRINSGRKVENLSSKQDSQSETI